MKTKQHLQKALVYVAHALHASPQHMLAKGITLIDGDTVRVSIDGWTVEASSKTTPQLAQQEPVAYLHQCGKKPELKELSFKKNEPLLAAKGYKTIPLTSPQPAQSKPLTFDEVEGCFPDGGGTNEYGEAVVSAQWLHDFAAAVQRAAHGIKENT